jgi:hypothetical protein
MGTIRDTRRSCHPRLRTQLRPGCIVARRGTWRSGSLWWRAGFARIAVAGANPTASAVAALDAKIGERSGLAAKETAAGATLSKALQAACDTHNLAEPDVQKATGNNKNKTKTPMVRQPSPTRGAGHLDRRSAGPGARGSVLDPSECPSRRAVERAWTRAVAATVRRVTCRRRRTGEGMAASRLADPVFTPLLCVTPLGWQRGLDRRRRLARSQQLSRDKRPPYARVWASLRSLAWREVGQGKPGHALSRQIRNGLCAKRARCQWAQRGTQPGAARIPPSTWR